MYMNLLTLQNSMLPPSQRAKNQTDKSATGPYNRKKLLQWLEEKAKNEKDWEQYKPYVREKRGKSNNMNRETVLKFIMKDNLFS